MPGAFNPDVTLPGLWTDKPDWLTQRPGGDRAHQSSGCRPVGALRRPRLAVDEGAIEPEFVDTLVDEIRKLRRHPGYFATTDFRTAAPTS